MKSSKRKFAIIIAALACTTFAVSVASAQEKETKLMNVAEGIDASKIWDGRKLAPFKALDNPPFVAADKVDYLDDTEYVLGVTIKGVSRAYPTRYVWFHHVVNDSIGATNFAITYCSVCNTGIAYDLKLDGKEPLALDFYGLYNGIVALCDRKTEGVFPQALGKFVSGPLSGKELKILPLLDTTWGAWRKLHPDTVVMSPKTTFEKIYNKRGHLEPRDYKAFPAPYFKPSVSRIDKRLAPFDKTLGLGVNEDGKPQFRAYPFKTLEEQGVVNDELGKTKVAVFYDAETVSAVALDRTLEGKTYDFESKKSADGKATITDKQTSSEWTIEGVATSGPLKGKSLTRLNGHQSQWYGWSATFPDTSIFGNSAAPMSLTDIPEDHFTKKAE